MRRIVAIVVLCCACGCMDAGGNLPVPPTPEPDAPVVGGETINDLTSTFNSKLRTEVYEQSAANLESGKWATETQLFDGEQAAIDKAFDEAAQGLANRMQRETGGTINEPWTAKRAAKFRRKIAQERDP